ncbi:hypothetical protein PCLA_18r0037 [Pseudomonas citronellolis]|nr:hypothetical protein PCLA_18r0037 [Pseudomonas citronellolis]
MARQGGQSEKNHVKTLPNSFLSHSDCSTSPTAIPGRPAENPQSPAACAPQWSAAVQFAPKPPLQFAETIR